MIAEPFICTKGRSLGMIEWWDERDPKPWGGEIWQPYADFEREKLKELNSIRIKFWDFFKDRPTVLIDLPAYWIEISDHRSWNSDNLIGYTLDKYLADSESNRLIKRAEFLKAVCEKEGVDWLPKPTDKEKCEGCKQAKFRGPDYFCPKHWVMPSSGLVDADGEPTDKQEEPFNSLGDAIAYGKRLIAYGVPKKPTPPEKDYYTKSEEDEFRKDILLYFENETYGICDEGKRTYVKVLRKKYNL